jgi:hypothetical protein
MMSSPRIGCLFFSVPATSLPDSGIYGANRTDNHPPERNPKGFDEKGSTMVPLKLVYELIQIGALPALCAIRYIKLRQVCMKQIPGCIKEILKATL